MDVDEGKPGETVNVADLFKGKKGILFAVPGAFTPTCSEKHLPGFIDQAVELKAAGAEVVACVSVNDPFVMSAWGKQQEADGKVRMLADTKCELTKVWTWSWMRQANSATSAPSATRCSSMMARSRRSVWTMTPLH